jgi:hypothetical protein
MAEVRDGYRRTGTAPSGRVWVYRGLNPFEAADVHDGLPQFGGSDDSPKKDADLTKEQRASLYEQWKRTCVFGAIQPRVSADDSDPNATPFAELGPDMVWLYTSIIEATSLSGARAEEASSFRQEHGQRESALRNGRGSRRKAVRADAGVHV